MAAPPDVSPNVISLTMPFSDMTVPHIVHTVCASISTTESSPHELQIMVERSC